MNVLTTRKAGKREIGGEFMIKYMGDCTKVWFGEQIC